ncbi:MAG: ATP-binding protein [Nitrospira sp.]|nr:ATP-binding protein [Nitrospira sp.]MDH4368992.1 ATP-binding protein [Nitrospira sp.]MDH5347283.1 ATP-binding protein [Nitrospira sp.]MDH5496642.1 ATP-binding protein [Nitrospira sp.]MDH5726116.1 ATP-binding protein [Nitrospira sp.]
MGDIKARIYWLMGWRVVIVTLLLGLSLAFQVTKGERVETFYALIVFTYAVTIIYALLIRKLTDSELLVKFAWAQIVVDFLLETILIARTGGIESPFAVLYVISVTVASLVPRRRVGLLTASLCIILLGILTNVQLYGLAEVWGWLPHTRLSAAETLHAFGVYSLAFLVVGFLSGALADQLGQADLSLREKELGLSHLRAFHENIVHSISSGVFTTDDNDRITSFNPAAQEATGYSFEQVQGCPWREVFNWHPSQLDDDRTQDVSANMRFDVECKRSDGNRLILGMTLSPLHERGEQKGLVGVFKDLTQIRDLEEEMRRKQWLASLGEMSAGMAHEIRNPLGALAGAMQMLRKDLQADETSQRLMEIAVREATRLDAIITEFLQYARPPALNLAECDLNKVLAETLDLVQHEARIRKGISIRAVPCAEALWAQVDQDQMKQVFWNLAVNAFDAMPHGGQLTISTGCRKVDIAGRKADVVEVSFHDAGEGIPKHNLDNIFLPFFTTKKRGSGLGLAAVHRIVDLHGGWIKVDSQEGQGTRFGVCLPRTADSGIRLWHEGREPWKRS